MNGVPKSFNSSIATVRSYSLLSKNFQPLQQRQRDHQRDYCFYSQRREIGTNTLSERQYEKYLSEHVEGAFQYRYKMSETLASFDFDYGKTFEQIIKLVNEKKTDETFQALEELRKTSRMANERGGILAFEVALFYIRNEPNAGMSIEEHL